MGNRQPNLLVIWSISLLISISLPFGGYFIGRAGDCRPGQIDGQCGLSTFVWLSYGLISGSVILIGMTVYFLIAVYRRRFPKP
jgi:hypothetical protein